MENVPLRPQCTLLGDTFYGCTSYCGVFLAVSGVLGAHVVGATSSLTPCDEMASYQS